MRELKLVITSLNFASSSISDTGGQWLFEFLAERNISVRVLKMNQNELGDRAMIKLGELLGTQSHPAEELHLSHNQISTKGMWALFEGRKRFPNRKNATSPLWVRVDNNFVTTRGLLNCREAGVSVEMGP